MDGNQIKQWEKRVGTKKTQMPDLPCFEENLATALDAALDNLRPSAKPVLFVLSVRNWKGYNGFRLRNEAYSAYPSEKQILFFQGLAVFVLKVHKVTIDNSKDGFEAYKGKQITLIHLCNWT